MEKLQSSASTTLSLIPLEVRPAWMPKIIRDFNFVEFNRIVWTVDLVSIFWMDFMQHILNTDVF